MFNNSKYKGMIITDLDGTLLNSNDEISFQNIDTLNKLEKNGYCRVIATGRSVFSFRKVIPEGFPIDYLIFSTGAGVLNWQTNKLEYCNNLPAAHVTKISKVLKSKNLNFMVHKPAPNNHKFEYFTNTKILEDFDKRCKLYEKYSELKKYSEDYTGEACQFLTIFDKIDNTFTEIIEDLNEFKVIRATSPLGGNYIWMEIFPKNVSKGKTIEWLCKHLDVNPQNTLGIGNDYNDIDMLEFTHKSSVVKNAPEQLKSRYNVVESNNNNGFSQAVSNFINRN